MTDLEKKFLMDLADLLRRFNATLTYTTDDDGIHITLNGKELFCGFLHIDPYKEILKHLGKETND